MVHKPDSLGLKLAPYLNQVGLDIKSAQLYQFTLPFKHKIELKHGPLQYREGLILVLTDRSGQAGLGEISPLPGFSQETLQSAIINTTKLIEGMVSSPQFVTDYLISGSQSWEKHKSPSVVHYGVEAALLSLLANKLDTSLGSLLFEQSCAEIPINGLISSPLSEWVPEAVSLVQDGYTSLKIKVGRISHELEALGIQSIRQSVGPEVHLRLDANRSWNLETALQFGHAIEHSDIEYIEEPLQNPADLPRFYDGCGVHFAFDETLHHIIDPSISFKSYTGLKAFVLKPTLIGCMGRFFALVNQARSQDILAVLSSSFESDVGLSILAQLAAGANCDTVAAGLDTRSAFAAGTSKQSATIQNGSMSVKQLTDRDLDLSHCELLHEK